MMHKVNRLISFLLLISFVCYGQTQGYHYQRKLEGITGTWHRILLPDDLYGKTLSDLSDIRILGITNNKDTVEAPYLLRTSENKTSVKEVPFNRLNFSQHNNEYFYTFEMPAQESINQIKLDFNRSNFDWQIQLEGSQNQQEWFTIVDHYRILSIKNEQTDFQFTNISLPTSNYRYYRLKIPGRENPEWREAKFSKQEKSAGSLRSFSIEEIKRMENRSLKQTEIELDLQQVVPVSRLTMSMSDTFDYYRAYTLLYLRDSFQTEKGWNYNYDILSRGIINSGEENVCQFNSSMVRKLKLIIHNQDNHPLHVKDFQVQGYVHELVARFTEPATYYLFYGNQQAHAPNYDIAQFSDKIPTALSTLTWSDEVVIEDKTSAITKPPLMNKIWLWVVMIGIIVLLGWFSLRMIQKR